MFNHSCLRKYFWHSLILTIACALCVFFFSLAGIDIINRYPFWGNSTKATKKPLQSGELKQPKEINIHMSWSQETGDEVFYAGPGRNVLSHFSESHRRTKAYWCIIQNTLQEKSTSRHKFWYFRLPQIEDSIQYLEGPNGIWKHHDGHIGVHMDKRYSCHGASRYHLVLPGTE